MSQQERTGFRDSAYSRRHRSASIQRYVGVENASRLGMIDLDAIPWAEFDGRQFPLTLIETARYTGHEVKVSTVTANLGKMAGIEAFCVLYEVEGQNGNGDCIGFRVREIAPQRSRGWKRMTPQQYADFLLWARRRGAAVIDQRFQALIRDEEQPLPFDDFEDTA